MAYRWWKVPGDPVRVVARLLSFFPYDTLVDAGTFVVHSTVARVDETFVVRIESSATPVYTVK